VLEHQNVESAAVIGHSQGAADAAIAALILAQRAKNSQKPPPIKNLILYNPSGLTDESTLKIARAFSINKHC